MGNSIESGAGKRYEAKVDKDLRLWTSSKSESLQHLISENEEQAYQIIGTATLANTTVTAIHVKNTSSDFNMVITYIRHQILDHSGGTAFPNVSNYYQIALGRTFSAGGSTATPINIHCGSANLALVTAYQGAPTLAGTAREIDRWYTKAEGDMNVFNKEGSLIIPPNETIELSYIGDQTGGTIYTRMSFIMEDRDL